MLEVDPLIEIICVCILCCFSLSKRKNTAKRQGEMTTENNEHSLEKSHAHKQFFLEKSQF